MSTIYQTVNRQKDAEAHDYYATDPQAAYDLLARQPLSDIWEPACGEGHLAKAFDRFHLLRRATDLIDRGYGTQFDFLSEQEPHSYDGDIVTNPPYKYATEFVLQALKVTKEARRIAMFLPITFLETINRYDRIFREHPPIEIYVYSKRLVCAKNGDFEKARATSTMKCYAWFVWWNTYNAGDSPALRWIR